MTDDQIKMGFIKSPNDDFSEFHKRNTWIWRIFRTYVLQAVNSGHKKVNAAELLNRATNGVVLRPEIVEKYKELFIANHQELENVFKMSLDDPEIDRR